MLYRSDISGCLADALGPRGLAAAELDAVLARTGASIATLKRRRDDGSLPLLRLPARRDDLDALAPLAGEFRRRFAHVLVLGIGGSSLGGQTLAALADLGFGPRPGAPRLHFMENIDPASFAALFIAIDPAKTGIIAISKSGGTAETLTQLVICLDWLRQSLGTAALGDRLIVLTEPRDNPLRRLGQTQQARLLDHDPGVGGRFTVLANVAVLPALIAGLDAAALREGAAEVLAATLGAAAPRQAAPALGAALSVALAEKRGIGTTVLMPYIDRLAAFGLWFRQLWAESLGKEGKGTTPVRAMGAIDQHSQLQLYLAGPPDKMFTLIMLDAAGQGDVMPPDLAGDRELAYLGSRRMGDLLEAEQRATAATLIRNGRPTRVMRLAQLDEKSLGALLMHFMLETIVAADLLGVNAFDQPAVEEGKVLARQYLGESGRGGAQ
jgi:glucose-6-phosphate isomerase